MAPDAWPRMLWLAVSFQLFKTICIWFYARACAWRYRFSKIERSSQVQHPYGTRESIQAIQTLSGKRWNCGCPRLLPGNIENDLFERIKTAMNGLDAYRKQAQLRILHLKRKQLCYYSASTIVLDAFRKGIVGTSMLKRLVKEWDNPSYEEFQPRTAWSLTNALTHVIKDRQQKYPIRAADETLRFQAICA